MASNGMCLLLFLIFSTSTMSCIKVLEEPVCTSRFDFESGLVREMMKLEFEMSQLKDQTNIVLTKLGAKLDDGIKDVKETLIKDFASMRTYFEIKADTKMQAIEDQAVKPFVAFLARTVSDKSPGENTHLTFTVAVTNAGDAYDTSTGFFTTPTNGTYLFSVQICPRNSKYMSVEIYAENKVIGASLMYDHTGHSPCSTTSAVSVLTAGNKVHVTSGDYVSSGEVIYQDSARWSIFSGVIV